MNPLVAILTLWMLIRQLNVSSRELALSRQEMSASSAALERQAVALERRELREDLGRTISSLESRLDNLISEVIELGIKGSKNTQQISFPDFSLTEFTSERIAATKQASRWFSEFTRTVEELGDALQEYDKVAPAKIYTEHIRKRFYRDLESAVMNGWISEDMWSVFYDKKTENTA